MGQSEKYGLILPISLTTTHSWMIKVGCKYDPQKQAYYTDAHKRSDVVDYRQFYPRTAAPPKRERRHVWRTRNFCRYLKNGFECKS